MMDSGKTFRVGGLPPWLIREIDRAAEKEIRGELLRLRTLRLLREKGGSTLKKLAEGKTKIIYDAGGGRVVLYSKDDITAGDGTKHDIIEGKGAISTTTTANVFRLLNQHGVPTHFLERLDENSLLCIRCDMIPLEVTIRGTAAGHYLKRNPGTEEGIDLAQPVVEFNYKDDALHDPFVDWTDTERWRLHDPEEPVSPSTLIREIKPLLTPDEVDKVRCVASDVFTTLRSAWKDPGVKMLDLKIEFGRTSDGRIIVGDVIDNDSWRIWPEGDKEKQLDKQIYREGGSIREVLANYKAVAKLTEQFPSSI